MRSRSFDYSRAMTLQPVSKIVSKKELAKDLGVSLTTISRMIKDGRLPSPMRTSKGYVGGWFRYVIEEWLKGGKTH